MTKIFLIRHAESVANTLGIYQGQTYDTGLSELGKKQAVALGYELSNQKISTIFSGPLKRTKETANEISKATDVSIDIDNRLIETNHGDWEGMSKGDIQKIYPDIYESWMKNPVNTSFPNGETFSETVARTEAFLTANIFDENCVVVTHDNIIRAMLSIIENRSVNRMWEYDLEPTGITEIEVDYANKDKFFKIIKINEVSHLKNLRADLSKHAL